jgi:hypothetical protein
MGKGLAYQKEQFSNFPDSLFAYAAGLLTATVAGDLGSATFWTATAGVVNRTTLAAGTSSTTSAFGRQTALYLAARVTAFYLTGFNLWISSQVRRRGICISGKKCRPGHDCNHKHNQKIPRNSGFHQKFSLNQPLILLYILHKRQNKVCKKHYITFTIG